MTVAEALKLAVTRLKAASVSEPIRDARKILRTILGPSNSNLDPEQILSVEQACQFDISIDERARFRPVSKIIGKREFWGREFQVTNDTLDPRPDSELIIEIALRPPTPKTILDLGTGTGCLLITLLAEFGDASGTGVDISQNALAVARENAAGLGVSERAEFLRSDWFEHVSGVFDLIVCNPPYISETELLQLDRDVKEWDPKLALCSGEDGLEAYRTISLALGDHLASGGRAIFEIGHKQGMDVREILCCSGFDEAEIVHDINGKARAVVVEKSN